MPVPTAPPTTTALAAANTAVPRARRPNAAASSRAHTRISDVAPPVCPLGNARVSSRPMVRSTTGFPNVVISPVSPGPPTASTAARGAPVTRQTRASRAAETVTTGGAPSTVTARTNPSPAAGSASTARSRWPSTWPAVWSPA